MAAHLTLGLALVMLIGAPRVFAQGLSDPTRPPREIIGGGAAPAEFAANPSPAQVVIISTDRRRATINGQAVALGGRYGNATLVRISDEEIVLQRPEGTETIKLYSSVQRTKRWASAQENVKTPGRREEGTHEAK
jgi:MSHA biogenesis protein MshK